MLIMVKDFFFWFPTVFPQGFQLETNHCSHWVGPQRGKALAQEILFKVQVVGLLIMVTDLNLGFLS